jgi:hypothetical protein
MCLGKDAASQTANRSMMEPGLSENNYPVTANDDSEFVAGFDLQSLAGFTRDHDLVLRRESRFRHRFTY